MKDQYLQKIRDTNLFHQLPLLRRLFPTEKEESGAFTRKRVGRKLKTPPEPLSFEILTAPSFRRYQLLPRNEVTYSSVLNGEPHLSGAEIDD
jgi:hypothetical protein